MKKVTIDNATVQKGISYRKEIFLMVLCQAKILAHLVILTLFVIVFFFSPARAGISIRVYHLQCEYLNNPLALDEMQPRLGWILQAVDSHAHGQRQTAYKILVASSQNLLDKNEGDVWNTGWVFSGEMQHIVYKGRMLLSDRGYYWKVKVKDEKGRVSGWSAPSYWNTGLLHSSDWKAAWIGSSVIYDYRQRDCNIPDPWLRKCFELKTRPGKAILFVASVGFHEVYVNGQRMGKDVLVPAVTDNAKRARYVAYDIAPELKAGKNIIALWMGTSWSIFGPFIAADRPNTPIVMAQVAIYEEKNPMDSARPLCLVKTDKSWEEHPSPSRLLGSWDANRMGGELYDGRMEDKSWNTLKGKKAGWQTATEYHPHLVLSSQQVEGNRLFEEIHPVAVLRKVDAYRVDMGVNFAGWTEIKIKGNPGDTVHFFYSEKPDEVVTFGLHSMYIMGKSGEGIFRNRFNYSSGRWITIKGLRQKPLMKDIKGWVVHTAYFPVTRFSCSDTLQNWIYDRIRWNFENLSIGGYVVDCPQRERMGYGGDAHATIETGMFNFGMGAFYTKWMEDWRDVKGTETVVGNMYDSSFAHQQLMGGRYLDPGILPHTAPTYAGGGGPPWGGIVVTLPWTFYSHYGDIRVLEKNFNLIKDWLAFLDSHTQNHLLQRYGGQWDFLGDWLWPNATAKGMNNDKPENICFNNCYRVFNLRTAAKIAQVLQKNEYARKWEQEAVLSSEAINKRFYNKDDHSYADGSMSNLAAALLAGVPPDTLSGAVMQRLEKEILVNRKGHIHAGITGGALLFRLLREKGRNDLIYAMTSQKDYPGWGYMKAQGATTIWEAWEKDLPGYSLLHSSYLYPGAWFIDGLAGIRRDPVTPGFRKFIIRVPQLSTQQVRWVRIVFDSPAGCIKCAWQKRGKSLRQEITVPPNCIAEVQLPQKAKEISGFGNPFVHREGILNGYLCYHLESGKYELISVAP